MSIWKNFRECPMSKLDKLMVRGIRSFGPGENNVLEFNTPLTLIVGRNGTGKTTIIECLKYATTGSFPPNTKGGAFVYDPAMAGEIDVKAEIRLKFTNNAKESIVCLRTLQVSQRGGRQIQKTLETSLSRETGTDTVLLSSKLAEIDRGIPEHLGVSPPLLDSVIFCHQEESTWPISEPRVLKERLDQIFCSVKYNKALKGLKDAKKSIGTDIRLKEQQLEFLQKEKAKKEAIHNAIQNTAESISSKSTALAGLQEERKRVEKSLLPLLDEIRIYERIEANHRLIKVEFDNCRNYIKSFGYETLGDDVVLSEYRGMGGSEPVDAGGDVLDLYRGVLQNQIRVYEDQNNGVHLEKLEEEYYQVERAAQHYLEGTKRRRGLCESLADLKRKMAEKRGEREKILGLLKSEFGCEEGNMDERISQSFLRVEREISGMKEKLKKDSESLACQKKRRDELESELKATLEKDGDIRQSDIDVDQVVVVDYARLLDLEADLHEITEDHAAHQAQMNRAFQNTELAFKKTRLEEQLLRLREEASESDVQALESRIKMLEERLSKTQLELQISQDEIRNDRANSEQRKNKMLKMAEESEYLLTRLRNRHGDDGDSKGRIISLVLDALAWPCEFGPVSKEEVVSSLIEETFPRISGVLGLRDEMLVAEELRSVDQFEREAASSSSLISATSNAAAIYRNFLSLGKQKGGCPLCKTPLANGALSQFTARLERVVLKIPAELSGAEKRRRDLENTLEKIKEENTAIDEANAVKEKLRGLKKEVQRLLVATVSERLKMIAKKVREHGAEKADGLNVNSLLNVPSQLVAQKEREVVEIHRAIGECRASVAGKTKAVESMRCLEEQIENMQCEGLDVKNISRILEESKAQMDGKRKAYLDFKKIVKEKEELKAMIDQERHNRSRIRKREQLVEEVEGVRCCDYRALENAVREAEERLAKENEGYLRSKVETEIRVRSLGEIALQISGLEKEVLRCRSMIEGMAEAEDEGVLRDRIGKEKELSDVRVEECMSRMTDELLRQRSGYIETVKRIDRCSTRLKVVEENMRLRSCKERIMKIQEEFKSFDIQKLGVLRGRVSAHEEKKARICNAESSIRGELKQLNMSLASCKNDLAQNFSEVPREYSRCAIELRALEMSTHDLDRCIGALDKAIVDFHGSKIDEVNATLRELWTSTYRGNDIECIELRSESSDSKAYNYSVVMLKNGTRMEMRGRCSAGQKMIASILIRLAIADSFSSNCNILALDEPTTNLDRENIESLAETLSRLIRERCNVQLIIISHDEEFVELLNREGIDYFYRLRRDSNGGSHIERHSVYSAPGDKS